MTLHQWLFYLYFHIMPKIIFLTLPNFVSLSLVMYIYSWHKHQRATDEIRYSNGIMVIDPSSISRINWHMQPLWSKFHDTAWTWAILHVQHIIEFSYTIFIALIRNDSRNLLTCSYRGVSLCSRNSLCSVNDTFCVSVSGLFDNCCAHV